MQKAKILACKTNFQPGNDLEVNDQIDCPLYKAMIEIIRLSPPELNRPVDPITSPTSR